MAEKTGQVANIVGGLIAIGIGLGAIFLNGWDFVFTNWAVGNGAEHGFWIGDFNGTAAFLIQVNGGWYGFARVHPDWAIVDSKVLNVIGLFSGLCILVTRVAIFFGLHDDDASTANLVEHEPEPTKALREYLLPTDTLWPIMTGPEAETIMVGGKQLTQAPAKVSMDVSGHPVIHEQCYIAIDEHRRLIVSRSGGSIELFRNGEHWEGWYDDSSRPDLPAIPLHDLVRDGGLWKNESVSIAISPHLACSAKPDSKRPNRRLLIAVAGLLMVAVGVGAWLGSDIISKDRDAPQIQKADASPGPEPDAAENSTDYPAESLSGTTSSPTTIMTDGDSDLAQPGRCLLVVDERTYMDGRCTNKINSDGSADIYGDQFFALIDPPVDGLYTVTWNEVADAPHADVALGQMVREGYCWSNERAKICAWPGGR